MMLHNPLGLVPATRSASHRGRVTSALVERRIRQLSARIEATLRHDILPRMSERRIAPDQTDMDRLCRLAIAGDAGELRAAVTDDGRPETSAESVCLDILTPIARRLGEWWEEDRCSFVEVTLGMLALQEVLRGLAPQLSQGPASAFRRSALMLPMPGEQHSFGIAMLSEFFRSAGWHVAQDTGLTTRALLRRVSGEWFGLVAISCAVNERLPALPGLIEALREQSLNPDIAIMVGGAAFQDPAATEVVAVADASAKDAAEALRQAEKLIGLMADHA